MMVGVDVALGGRQWGGIGAYITNLLPRLIDEGRHDYTLLAPMWSRDIIAEPENLGQYEVRYIESNDTEIPDEFIPRRAFWEQEILPEALADAEVDAYFGPAFMCPLSWQGPKVVTVHDLVFEASDWFNTGPNTSYYRQWARRCAAVADSLITVSDSTRRDMESRWGIPADRVRVTPLAHSLPFISTNRAEARSIVCKRFGVADRYFLIVGGFYKRKNVARIIEAYAVLRDQSEEALPSLVIVAKQSDEYAEYIERRGLTDAVTFTGYVQPDMMPHLYAGSVALLYLSLYEGFGLPVLEAMASGAPTITSPLTSLPEVAGDASMIVDPFDVLQIADAMYAIARNPVLANSLMKAGMARARLFSWDRCANDTVDILDAVKTPRGLNRTRRDTAK